MQYLVKMKVKYKLVAGILHTVFLYLFKIRAVSGRVRK